ncbi:MAG TPA: polyprenyl synthetase family protein [Mycobacteriales bacterium]|nr:polyprenyl synthetase family protein [Mycobacteriales bacterium]
MAASRRSVPSPLDVADLRERVHKALSAFLAEQVGVLDRIAEELGPIGTAVSDFLLDGGKRLRPAFCYWGWRGAGGPDSDEIVAAAASLELLQACALIHDDVMDGSDTRRGRPAVHRGFAALHRGEGWLGDPETFGTSAAILLGDLCLIWADQLLNTCGLPDVMLRRGAPTYDEMRVELMAGQYLDLLEQALGGRDIDRALRVARYKSAKYTIERPLHLGGVLAGAPTELLATYTGYGLPLGEAFQLRDDVLGVFGDPSETGKPAGDDLREGKRTALVAIALDRATPDQAAVVRRHLGDPHLDERGVALLRDVIDGTGALAEVEALIARRTDEAHSALGAGVLEPAAREVLGNLVSAATSRRV